MHHTLVVQRDHRCHGMYAAHEQPHLFDTIQHSNHIGAGAVCIVRSGQIVIHILAVHNTYTCLTTVCEYGSGVLLHNVMGGYNRVSCCNGVHKLLLTCACVYEALIELAIGTFEYIFGHVARQAYASTLWRSDRVYESIVRRLHCTHFIRCVICGRNTALPHTGGLEGKVYCLEWCGTIQILRQVTIIEHTGDMRLQHIRPDEVQITFIGSLPQDTTGKLALVALDVFGEVFSRAIKALIRQGVLS